MKILYFLISVAIVSALASINHALAKPPGEANILHCGCVAWSDGTIGMAFVPIEVSTKGKVHLNHLAGTTDSCYDGISAYVDVTRKDPDCQVDGIRLPGMEVCKPELGQVEFAACEVESVPQ
jgi:hypothetical protein